MNASRTIEARDGFFRVRAPWKDADVIKDAIKRFPVREYIRTPPRSFWKLPANEANTRLLMPFAKEFDFTLTEQVQALYDRAMEVFGAQANDDAPEWEIVPGRLISDGRDKWGRMAYLLIWEFDQEVYRLVSALPEARYCGGRSKIWSVPKAHGAAVWEIARALGFSVPARLRAEMRPKETDAI